MTEKELSLEDKILQLGIQSIVELTEKISELHKQRQEQIKLLQSTCPHKEILRLPFEEGVIIDRKPLLICRLCRLRFCGWTICGDPLHRSFKDYIEVSEEEIYEAEKWK